MITLPEPLTDEMTSSFSLPEDGWFHIATPGEWPHKPTGLVQVIDEEALEAIIASFLNEKTASNWPGVLIDFDHQSLDQDKPSVAAGWIVELEKRPTGIWARIRWSDVGRKSIEGGRYRFISPVWRSSDCAMLDNDRIRPLKLMNCAVTNDPNIKGLFPLSNSMKPVPGRLSPPAMPIVPLDPQIVNAAPRRRRPMTDEQRRAMFAARRGGRGPGDGTGGSRTTGTKTTGASRSRTVTSSPPSPVTRTGSGRFYRAPETTRVAPSPGSPVISIGSTDTGRVRPQPKSYESATSLADLIVIPGTGRLEAPDPDWRQYQHMIDGYLNDGMTVLDVSPYGIMLNDPKSGRRFFEYPNHIALHPRDLVNKRYLNTTTDALILNAAIGHDRPLMANRPRRRGFDDDQQRKAFFAARGRAPAPGKRPAIDRQDWLNGTGSGGVRGFPQLGPAKPKPKPAPSTKSPAPVSRPPPAQAIDQWSWADWLRRAGGPEDRSLMRPMSNAQVHLINRLVRELDDQTLTNAVGRPSGPMDDDQRKAMFAAMGRGGGSGGGGGGARSVSRAPVQQPVQAVPDTAAPAEWSPQVAYPQFQGQVARPEPTTAAIESRQQRLRELHARLNAIERTSPPKPQPPPDFSRIDVNAVIQEARRTGTNWIEARNQAQAENLRRRQELRAIRRSYERQYGSREQVERAVQRHLDRLDREYARDLNRWESRYHRHQRQVNQLQREISNTEVQLARERERYERTRHDNQRRDATDDARLRRAAIRDEINHDREVYRRQQNEVRARNAEDTRARRQAQDAARTGRLPVQEYQAEIRRRRTFHDAISRGHYDAAQRIMPEADITRAVEEHEAVQQATRFLPATQQRAKWNAYRDQAPPLTGE